MVSVSFTSHRSLKPGGGAEACAHMTRHGFHVLLTRMRARQAFSGVFAVISTSRLVPPSDPYFGLRGFPWPNACLPGIFVRSSCCNRHFSSRTRTRHFLVLPWLVPLWLGMVSVSFTSHRSLKPGGGVEACAPTTRHGFHVFHFSQ